MGERHVLTIENITMPLVKIFFPFLFIDHVLERLANYSYFCYLNGYLGFFQILFYPKNQENTIFTCHYGIFAYKHMSFGLFNAPTTFQICMMSIFMILLSELWKYLWTIFLYMAHLLIIAI